MVAAWLLENFNGALFGANIFEGSDRELGNSFEPATDARATWIRWWRPSTTPAQKPTLLRIWDTTTSTVLWSTSTIPDTGAVGWQAAVIPETPVVLGGRRYVVSHAWQTNRQHPTYGIGTVRPAPFPGSFGAPIGYQSAAGVIGLPGTGNTGQLYGIDLRLLSRARPIQWESVGQSLRAHAVYHPAVVHAHDRRGGRRSPRRRLLATRSPGCIRPEQSHRQCRIDLRAPRMATHGRRVGQVLSRHTRHAGRLHCK
jgi:hypothetical protein